MSLVAVIFFSGWMPLVRTFVVAVCAYFGMLIMLRVSGHRTLAQMNAFDMIVTVALGSTLASVITSSEVALAQGLLAFALLVGIQYLIAWSTRASKRIEQLVNGSPILLLHKGKFLDAQMRQTRITEDEVKAAARSQGIAGLGDVEAAILETNGKLSIVPSQPTTQPSALEPVTRFKTEQAAEA